MKTEFKEVKAGRWELTQEQDGEVKHKVTLTTWEALVLADEIQRKTKLAIRGDERDLG